MSTAAQVLRQAESLKATLVDHGKVNADTRATAAVDNSNNGRRVTADSDNSGVGVKADGKGVSTDSANVNPVSGMGEGRGKEGGGGAVSDTWVTRQKLEDMYKRLLLMDLEYALDKKVEQDLWNHAFKNQITTLQIQAKEKQNPKKAEVQANLNLFLETASGFYLQFLQLICSTFHLDLPFRRKSSAFGVMKEKTQLRARITPPKRNSCLYICQYCLVHLGDIARYRQQTEQAQTYYRHAVNLSPQNGQPYNQLAILEVNRNNKLSSVFYYVRSLAVRHPFPAAATNLEKFYSKLVKDTSEFKGKMAQNEFVNAFLQFQALLHLAADLRRASYLCGRILSCLPSLLLAQMFSGGVLVQCVAVTIFTLNSLRHVPSGGDLSSPSLSSASSPKGGEGGGDGEGGGGGGRVAGGMAESMLSTEEQKSVDVILAFTASVLELLVQHTPVVGVKARESPTLPAVQVLLDWLITSPDLITSPPFACSNIWGHLAKMLNVIQQTEEGKAGLDLTKYDEVPLSEDTELRCFQPMEKAHSKYSFSSVPIDGFPRGVEEQVRCARLVKQGKTIAEDYPELKMTAIQQSDPPRINFSGPLVMKSAESLPPSTQERRAKQNVAMQAIMKHGLGSQLDSGRGGCGGKEDGSSSSSEQSSPKYLLGTVTSEPQFMKHGGGATSSSRLQTSPQLSPGFPRRSQSPQSRGAPSPLQGLTSPRVASPRPGGGRVASPLPASQQQQQQQASVPAPQRSPQQQQVMPPSLPHRPPEPTGGQHSLPVATTTHQGTAGYPPPLLSSSSSTHVGNVGYQTSTTPPSAHPGKAGYQPPASSPPGRSQLAQHPYLGGLPFQGPTPPLSPTAACQGHPRADQGHLPGQIHMAQGQGHGFPGMAPLQGPLEKGGSGPSMKPGPAVAAHFPLPFPLPFTTGPSGDRFHGPHLNAPVSAGAQPDLPRMPHYPSGQGAVPSEAGPKQGGGCGPRHPLNQEMLSALRLASQISHAQGPPLPPGDVTLPVHAPQQQQQSRGQEQPPPPLPPSHAMYRPPIQRPPISAHGPAPMTAGPAPRTAGPAPGQHFQGSPMSRAFLPGMAMSQHPSGDHPMHFPPGPHPHPHPHPRPRMHGAMATHGHEAVLSEGLPTRLPAPPIAMQGQRSSAFPTLMTGLFPKDGGGGGPGEGGGRSGYQALSPLTIQPPKSSPPDTRISSSFQGHAEGTPKPDKQEGGAPEKREGEPVLHRMVMPVGQPGGEYSLFASSSPWSMPLNSSSDSKSMASSPLSSHDSSMRNSPVLGFEPQPSAPYDMAVRHKGMQGEGWMGQGQGHDEQKGRGQATHPGGVPSMWTEAAVALTPLERLLEQQRLQRQTDPH